MAVFHRTKRSRDSGDLYVWISNIYILDLLGLLWRPDQRELLTVFRLLALSTCLPWMHIPMHTEHSFDAKQFQSLFSVASLQGALPTPPTSPRHVPGWRCREGAGRLWDTSKRIIQRILSHKSCSTSTFSQGCALCPGSQRKLLSSILLSITHWAQEGIWKEGRSNSSSNETQNKQNFSGCEQSQGWPSSAKS